MLRSYRARLCFLIATHAARSDTSRAPLDPRRELGETYRTAPRQQPTNLDYPCSKERNDDPHLYALHVLPDDPAHWVAHHVGRSLFSFFADTPCHCH